jgi:hypothetical protein
MTNIAEGPTEAQVSGSFCLAPGVSPRKFTRGRVCGLYILGIGQTCIKCRVQWILVCWSILGIIDMIRPSISRGDILDIFWPIPKWISTVSGHFLWKRRRWDCWRRLTSRQEHNLHGRCALSDSIPSIGIWGGAAMWELLLEVSKWLL